MKNQFLEELRKIIGSPYILGGGQMEFYKGLPNKDKNGNWLGFDCCGGIMACLRIATRIELAMRNVPGMMKAPWTFPIEKHQLIEADLIFVDIPAKDENGDVMRDVAGYPIYGVWNHVMTYMGEKQKGNIITTEGIGGDIRFNPNSKTTTRYYDLDDFERVSARIFDDTTRYDYKRIDWDWLENWKRTHNIT